MITINIKSLKELMMNDISSAQQAALNNSWRLKEQRLIKQGRSQAYIKLYKGYALNRIAYRVYASYQDELFDSLRQEINEMLPKTFEKTIENFTDVRYV